MSPQNLAKFRNFVLSKPSLFGREKKTGLNLELNTLANHDLKIYLHSST